MERQPSLEQTSYMTRFLEQTSYMTRVMLQVNFFA